jgi:hypothetical protein
MFLIKLQRPVALCQYTPINPPNVALIAEILIQFPLSSRGLPPSSDILVMLYLEIWPPYYSLRVIAVGLYPNTTNFEERFSKSHVFYQNCPYFLYFILMHECSLLCYYSYDSTTVSFITRADVQTNTFLPLSGDYRIRYHYQSF